jgi:hypothetical protein
MTNLEALRNPPKRATRCGTSTWLSQQDGPTQQAVKDALANSEWKSTDLHQLLQSEFGYELGYNQFTRHRNGVCCG